MDFKIFTNALGLSSNKESSTPLIKKKEESSDVVYEERKEILTWNSEVVGSTIPKRYKSAILIIGTLLLIYLILNRDAVLVVLILSLVFLYCKKASTKFYYLFLLISIFMNYNSYFIKI